MNGRGGTTLVEVLIASLILVAAAIPLMAMVQTGNRESVASENQMFAEILALGTSEKWARLDFRSLARQAPFDKVFQGLPGDDPRAVTNPAYASRLSGPLAFRTEVRIVQLREGLIGIEVAVCWSSGWSRREHRFSLARLKAQEDLSLELRYLSSEP